MITPSINTEKQKSLRPMSEETSLEEVLSMITADVNELRALYTEQARDAEEAATAGRQPDYRLRSLIRAWEHTQDVHWSWYKEILNGSVGPAEGLEVLGQSALAESN